jgi:hypothetical protein
MAPDPVAPYPRIVIFLNRQGFPEAADLRKGVDPSVCLIYQFTLITCSPSIRSGHDIYVCFIFH